MMKCILSEMLILNHNEITWSYPLFSTLNSEILFKVVISQMILNSLQKLINI